MSKEQVKKVMDKVVKEGKSMKQAMLEAGYSDTYSRTPQQLSNSRTWAELLNTEFVDEDLVKTHKGLMATKKIVNIKFPINTPDPDIKTLFQVAGGECLHIAEEAKRTASGLYKWRTGVGWILDSDMLDRQLDKVYKIKGYYKNADIDASTNIYTASLDQLEKIKNDLEGESNLFVERYKEYAPTKREPTKGSDNAKEVSQDKGATPKGKGTEGSGSEGSTGGNNNSAGSSEGKGGEGFTQGADQNPVK